MEARASEMRASETLAHARNWTSLYLMVRPRRSTKTLPRQAPVPSLLILISRPASTLMKSVERNWLP